MPPRPAKPDRSTRLAKALREAPPVKATPLDLYQLARRDWLAGERIDIGALASRLNIGRATAFRWVGSRDLLLSEILWSLCDELMATTAAGQRGRGAARVAGICEAAVRALVDFEPLRRFVRSDPEYAVRLLTSKLGPVQGRAIERVRALLQYEADRGALVPPLPVDTLAYLIVRLCESFVYADATSDQQVDVADAGLAIELLLSGRVAPRRAARGSRAGTAPPAKASPQKAPAKTSSSNIPSNQTSRSKR